jgi:hypothetical protein
MKICMYAIACICIAAAWLCAAPAPSHAQAAASPLRLETVRPETVGLAGLTADLPPPSHGSHAGAAMLVLDDDTPATRAPMYVAALVGGATGLAAGAFTGLRMEQARATRCHDGCGLGGAMLGAWLGSSTGAAVGAHIANDFAGNPFIGTAATAAVGAAGFLAGAWLSGGTSSNAMGKVALVAVPALQLHTAVRVELATARRR